MKSNITILAVAAILGLNNVKAQTPVDPSTFAGHYYTETNMKVDGKKSNELDMTFDEKTGAFSGVSPKRPEMRDKMTFYADQPKRKWAADTKIWTFANGNMNGRYYGEDMFSYDMHFGTFVEPGVFVIFDASFPADPVTKVRSWILNEKYPVRIMAKDESKLSMDKKEAGKKAIAQMTGASGAALTKLLGDQEKAAVAVPNETLSKTDKALKQEITNMLQAFNTGDEADFICAYTTSNDWKIINNNVTGRILSREINAEMILKNKKSGNCWRQPYTLTAQYNGTGYGKLAFLRKWDLIKCDCSQVDKNK